MRGLRVLLFIALFALGVYYVYTHLPVQMELTTEGLPNLGVDWKYSFRPAALDLLAGRSPYADSGFFNPPWLLLPLLPIALLSAPLGTAVMFILNLYSYIFAAFKLRMNAIILTVFVLFSGILLNSWNGNVEGLVVLGFLLPPQAGLFFVLCKPQFGIGVAAFWVIDAWIEGGFRQVVRVVTPVSVALVLSFALFGFWPAKSPGLVDIWWSSSLFPYGVPVGCALLGVAIWKRDLRFAIASSPFFAPYVTLHTWAVVWLGMLLLFPENLAAYREWRGISTPRLEMK